MTILAATIAVVVIFVGLLASIALHEIGHLVPAKLFGVKCTQFMVGFGRTMKSWRRGETEYGFKWLPLGGYVRMIGMFPPRPGEDEQHLRESSTGAYQTMADDARTAPAEVIAPEDADRVFYKLSTPKKVAVMFGGPFMNLVIAAVLLGGLTVAYADPTSPGRTTTTLSVVQECVRTADSATGPCRADEPRTPANAAGLLPGDRIVSFNNRTITDWTQIRDEIRTHSGQRMPLVVERDGQQVSLNITPMTSEVAALDADGNAVMKDGRMQTVQAGFIGVSPETVFERGSVTDVPGVIWKTFTGTANLVLNLPQKMVDVAQAAFGDEARDPTGPIGLVGVGRIAGEVGAAEDIALGDKVASLVGILGSLNMALFVFNLIPLLPLDGGHIAGALWEGLRRQVARLRRRPDPGFVDVSKALPLIYIVASVMIVMSLMLLYADIVKPITLRG